MSTEVPHPEPLSLGLGYGRVDDQAEPDRLLDVMDATAGWPAIIALRRFEAEQLAPADGDELLDVGCGRGDVTRALGHAVLPGGRAVGVDLSEAMLDDARRRAAAEDLAVTFEIGDVTHLGFPDADFDLVRTERVLQWVPDLDAAGAELVRVLRPGGRLGLVDTDWRTLAVDLPDLDAAAAVTAAMLQVRGPQAAAGGRLVNLCRALGLQDVRVQAATHVWTAWDPDAEPAPSGFFPLAELVPELVAAGGLDPEAAERFLHQAHDAGRRGRFAMSLTMFAVVATKPA